jgi:hypothetical protein
LPPWSRHAEAIPHILWKLQGSAKGWPLSGSAVGKRLAFEWSSYCCCSLPSLLRWLWFKNNPVIETCLRFLLALPTKRGCLEISLCLRKASSLA